MNILRVDASGRREGSTSRALVDYLVDGLASACAEVSIHVRDLADPLPQVDERWIQANFTAPEERNDAHEEALSLSDRLVDELKQADVLVIGTPIYNFGVPAALKAWVDLVARARLTFRYTEGGARGLLGGKRAVLVVASGGVAVDSEVDFATPYLRQALQFVGITEVDVIAADRQNVRSDEAVAAARTAIDELVRHWRSPATASRAA